MILIQSTFLNKNVADSYTGTDLTLGSFTGFV